MDKEAGELLSYIDNRHSSFKEKAVSLKLFKEERSSAKPRAGRAVGQKSPGSLRAKIHLFLTI